MGGKELAPRNLVTTRGRVCFLKTKNGSFLNGFVFDDGVFVFSLYIYTHTVCVPGEGQMHLEGGTRERLLVPEPATGL